MRQIFVLFLTVILNASPTAGQELDLAHIYPIETSHSFLEFEATYMGYAKVRGSFAKFYGSIYYDKDEPTRTSVSFQIDVESINTRNDWRDRDLKSKNWFLVEEHPHMRFTSTSARLEDNTLMVTGDLTIKDTTRQIECPVEVQGIITDIRGDAQVIFTGEYTINRKEFGVMGKNWSQVKEGIAALSDEVTISFSMLGKQIKEANFRNFLRRESSPPGSIYAAYQSEGVSGAITRLDSLKAGGELTAQAGNMVVYMLMLQEKSQDAITLAEYNLNQFPEDANAYDTLAELRARSGKFDEAKKLYLKSLKLNPANLNAVEILKHLD